MEIFIVLGLCFVLYEALDLFQGCYQHYHHSNNANNSLANIEKHNKSVLSRANKLIKDIIVEEAEEEDEDQLCLIEEGSSASSSSSSAALVGTSSPPPSCGATGEDLDRHHHRRQYQQLGQEDEESILVATIVPGETTILGLLEDNNRHDDGLIATARIGERTLLPPSTDSRLAASADMEAKKQRLLLKMELLNEKSSVLRPHTHQQMMKRMETTSSVNYNNNNAPTIGDNENHFATNYICRSVDYESTKKTLNNSGDRFIDSSAAASTVDYEQNVNMIRVFSVSECVQ